VVEREYTLLERYAGSNIWRQAWIRYYRMIYRDAFGRLDEVSFDLERYWNRATAIVADEASRSAAAAAFAAKALSWVQNFIYERNPEGSDFVNPLSAALEGRGDCDSRAMLMAIILEHADIQAAMMVSQVYSHAMALIDISGEGARIEANGTQWLVAETTAKVTLGQIAEENSRTSNWIPVVFE
jgi:transglutaminase-like putative cysteine protease